MPPTDQAETPRTKRRVPQTDFAKVDPGLLGVPLFQPLPKAGRSAARLRANEHEYEFAQKLLKVVSAYTLGAEELLVLLAVCALAGWGNRVDRVAAANSESQRIAVVDGLESDGEVAEKDHLRIKTRTSELIRESGLSDTGGTYKRLYKSLERLSCITYTEYNLSKEIPKTVRIGGKQRLLSVKIEELTGLLVIVLNARFTRAIFGGQYIRINLNESRLLGESTLILHTRLSVHIREGHKLPITLDRLAEWLYGDRPASLEVGNDRRKHIRKCLRDLAGKTSWTWREVPDRQQLVEIQRPNRGSGSNGTESSIRAFRPASD